MQDRFGKAAAGIMFTNRHLKGTGMNRRSFMQKASAVLGSALLSQAAFSAEKQAKRPTILIVLADEIGRASCRERV